MRLFSSRMLTGVILSMAMVASALSTSAAVAAPKSEVGICTPRLIAQRIQESVLAMKAAQYCQGMPYTIDQAAQRVEKMRCSSQASEMVDHLLNDKNAEYKLILKGETGQVACQKAALLDIS